MLPFFSHHKKLTIAEPPPPPPPDWLENFLLNPKCRNIQMFAPKTLLYLFIFSLKTVFTAFPPALKELQCLYVLENECSQRDSYEESRCQILWWPRPSASLCRGVSTSRSGSVSAGDLRWICWGSFSASVSMVELCTSQYHLRSFNFCSLSFSASAALIQNFN